MKFYDLVMQYRCDDCGYRAEVRRFTKYCGNCGCHFTDFRNHWISKKERV